LPRYEYECKKCGKVTEIITAMPNSEKVNCIFCGSETEKVINCNFRLKGNGWYNGSKE
jgi:putative FmdB family regulatory protein